MNAIEDAGFSFIVGSRITKAPYDLAEHFARHGDYFADGQIVESSRAMGSGRHERQLRVVCQWSFKRSQWDNKTINAQIARAEKATAGKAPVTRTRFLKVTGATRELNQKTIDRARQLAGLKGYVTNLDSAVMDGAAVIAAYHELWQVWSRPAARSRLLGRAVSAGRSPHPACPSQGTGRSASPASARDVVPHPPAGQGAGITVPRYRYHVVDTDAGLNSARSSLDGHHPLPQ